MKKIIFFILLAFIFISFDNPRSKYFEYYYKKSLEAANKGNASASIYYADSAISFISNIDSIYSLKANAYYMLGRPNQAIEQCEIALNLNKKNDYAYFIKGLSISLKNAYSDSLYDLIKRYKKDKEWFKENILNRYNSSSLENGNYVLIDYGLAIKYIDTCLLLNPAYINARMFRGLFYQYLNNYEKAIPDFDTCIKQDTNKIRRSWYYDYIGTCKEKMGLNEEARDAYTMGIFFNPKSGLLYEKRGMLYNNVWFDREYACKDLQKAMLYGRYIDSIEKYCSPSEYDFVSRMHGPKDWRHDYKYYCCPQIKFNPQKDTLIDIEIVPGVKEKMLDLKKSYVDSIEKSRIVTP
ncbi:MAG: tetratricopeptide repeat protein [Bacteroidales bacterium]|jgi:tetratricopeptide (TPR) repeat protein